MLKVLFSGAPLNGTPFNAARAEGAMAAMGPADALLMVRGATGRRASEGAA